VHVPFSILVEYCTETGVRLAHALRWEYSDKEMELAQLMGQPGVFLTCHFD
jgi:hypothetical protein